MSRSSQPASERPALDDDLVDGRNLLVVSNREPYQHRYRDDGKGIVVDEPVGGLTAGLDRVMQRTGGTWVAWGDGDADPEVVNTANCVGVPPDDPKYTLKRVWLGEQEMREYYYGFSNQVLWPLCHDLVGKAKFEGSFWKRYQAVNETFVDIVADRADDDTVVWFQDYHLALAPRLAREKLPKATFLQFWHIPWPAWDTFRVCPQRQELLEGLLGNDLLGFHIERYCQHFLDCVENCLDGATVDRETGEVHYDGRTTRVAAFPMTVDADRIERLSGVDDDFWPAFKRKHGIGEETKVAVGVERLDYTKGIPERLEAFERFWEEHPEWQGKLTYVQKASESRVEIPAYQELIGTVEEKIAHLNDRFGTDDWTPVVYIDETLPDEELYGLYRHSDLAVVTPIRDGMNLVAKEYVAAQTDGDGVLLLSDLAGADESLGDHALTVEPYDTAAFADQIEAALTMSPDERTRRMRLLREQVCGDDLDSWIRSLFGAVNALGKTIPAERNE
ncbi:trehalose 6-phosphate synthase [Halogranum amylolyticum]|uniref:Trehalose 6-phosphate synthase n=1 Tax=Halogranum amylolyticum TaxID=660520 RepID=A0A1H8R5K8_9EURY|nr:trehalose-6-phosphate synthase [Halogranum amylolyticum]SEO61949.1 trehalose 6-phosphate synthase [Halogranum amylolyticum]